MVEWREGEWTDRRTVLGKAGGGRGWAAPKDHGEKLRKAKEARTK